ncbi:MAG: hypothetical protein Q7U37_11610 [Gallionella sp.]|nr:hypothetical protein [Gallionella sp.]MDP1941737.1 hypothetical protein [Gallionella sp.]
MKIIRVGVDLAKSVFQVHGVDRDERPAWKRKLKRDEWLKVLLEKIEPGCEIGMEACGGAIHSQLYQISCDRSHRKMVSQAAAYKLIRITGGFGV